MKFQVTFTCDAELKQIEGGRPKIRDVERRIAEIIAEHLPSEHCTAVQGALLEVLFDSDPVVNITE